jgi:hypothetical protein
MALRQYFPKEQHCIAVFGRNGVTSPFLEGTELRKHFLGEQHCISVVLVTMDSANMHPFSVMP